MPKIKKKEVENIISKLLPEIEKIIRKHYSGVRLRIKAALEYASRFIDREELVVDAVANAAMAILRKFERERGREYVWDELSIKKLLIKKSKWELLSLIRDVLDTDYIKAGSRGFRGRCPVCGKDMISLEHFRTHKMIKCSNKDCDYTASARVCIYSFDSWEEPDMVGIGGIDAGSRDGNFAFKILETNELIAVGLGSLDSFERQIINARYFSHMNLREIAKLVGLSSGRVCQICCGSLTKMRRAIEKLDENMPKL